MNTREPLRRIALDAKLSPPAATPAQVPRQRLTEAIAGSHGVRLVVVRAPAGFGKTTAMLHARQLLERAKVRTAWLTVDRADNDAARFIHCLGAAIAMLAADEPEPEPSGDAAATLLDRLARCDGPFVLFLDEFEMIREPGVQRLVRDLVENLPRRGQVVIGTRAVPNLGLARSRARGQLLEIVADDLRFTLDETRDYLTVHRGLAIPPGELQQLHRKTEGWIAGLWLASVALARHGASGDFVARFSGSHLEVADYLTEDVLNLQPPEIRRFLLSTSVLRHLSAPLCAALVPDADCERILRRLESENVLITRVETEARGYRYHSLFASFLQSQLARERPDELRSLHAAASGWYASQQRPVPAIDHAVASGDLGLVLDLLGTHAMPLLQAGRLRLLTRWFDALPTDALDDRPRLLMVRLWALSCTRGPWDALDRLERSGLEASLDPAIRAHVTALRPMLLAMMDRNDEAFELAMAAIDGVPDGDRFAEGVLLASLATLCAARGLHVRALGLLDTFRARQGGAAMALNDMLACTVEGSVAWFEGRIREAGASFQAAVEATRSVGERFRHGNAWAGILHAAVVYETGAIDEATALLRVYVPLARDAGLPDHIVLGFRMLARIAFDAGDVDECFRLLSEMESLGHRRQLARVVASARLERSRLHLLQGHLDAAREELDRGSDPALWRPIRALRLLANDDEDPSIADLRWRCRAGFARDASAAIDAELQLARSARRLRRALKLDLLRAVARGLSGEDAVSELSQVLRGAWRDGFMRIVLDEGPALGVLVREVLARHVASRPDPDAPFAIWLHRLVAGFGELPKAEPVGAWNPGLDEYLRDPLTAKELRTLRLLAEGYSNRAMADKLFVSDSTVRTHLRGIHRKLGVQSRLQAVAVGRALGLVD